MTISNKLVPAILLCLLPCLAVAETPEEKGLSIAQEADRREAERQRAEAA